METQQTRPTSMNIFSQNSVPAIKSVPVRMYSRIPLLQKLGIKSKRYLSVDLQRGVIIFDKTRNSHISKPADENQIHFTDIISLETDLSKSKKDKGYLRIKTAQTIVAGKDTYHNKHQPPREIKFKFKHMGDLKAIVDALGVAVHQYQVGAAPYEQNPSRKIVPIKVQISEVGLSTDSFRSSEMLPDIGADASDVSSDMNHEYELDEDSVSNKMFDAGKTGTHGAHPSHFEQFGSKAHPMASNVHSQAGLQGVTSGNKQATTGQNRPISFVQVDHSNHMNQGTPAGLLSPGTHDNALFQASPELDRYYSEDSSASVKPRK